MATISIDDTLYSNLDKKRRNRSLQNYVEELLQMGLKQQEEKDLDEKIANYQLSDFTKSFKLKIENPVPADENGIEARIEKYL